MKYLVIVLLVALSAYFGYQLWQGQQIEEKSATVPTETTPPGEMMAREYTLEEVKSHDNKDDCYLAIEGKVYDVTEFVASGNHPGGEAILMGCGKDATELYNERPNGSGAHSDRAREMLPKYEIGVLAAN